MSATIGDDDLSDEIMDFVNALFQRDHRPETIGSAIRYKDGRPYESGWELVSSLLTTHVGEVEFEGATKLEVATQFFETLTRSLEGRLRYTPPACSLLRRLFMGKSRPALTGAERDRVQNQLARLKAFRAAHHELKSHT